MPKGIAKATGRNPAFRHGGKGTPEYTTWKRIKNRCFNSRGPDFKYYGGRGITVHSSWKNDFPAFLRAVGLRPSPLHSLDRIDNNGSYEPGNVRWATRAEQANNSRQCRFVTFRGETLSIQQHCRKWGVKRVSLDWWLRHKGDDPAEGLEHYVMRIAA